MSSRTIAAHAAAINAGELELNGEDLACLGMRRADPDPGWHRFFSDLKDFSAFTAAAAPAAPKLPRQRKPNIGRMIAAAERGGKNVTGITTPDGVTLHFGKAESTETSNPWLDDLKATKQ